MRAFSTTSEKIKKGRVCRLRLFLIEVKLLGSVLFNLTEKREDHVDDLLKVIDELLNVTKIFVEHFKTPHS